MGPAARRHLNLRLTLNRTDTTERDESTTTQTSRKNGHNSSSHTSARLVGCTPAREDAPLQRPACRARAGSSLIVVAAPSLVVACTSRESWHRSTLATPSPSPQATITPQHSHMKHARRPPPPCRPHLRNLNHAMGRARVSSGSSGERAAAASPAALTPRRLASAAARQAFRRPLRSLRSRLSLSSRLSSFV